MAQIISITSLFAFIFINYQLWRSVDSQLYAHLGDSFLDQEVTYDELYQSGMQSYTNEDWASTIFFFERALQEFDYFRASLTECRLKCQNVSHISSSGKDTLSELKVFEAVFKKADCTRRCKLKKLGGRSERIDDAVTDKFLSMTPYSYLQFAYYKSGLYEQAVAAAYTYLQWHSDDDVMQNNLDYYRNMHGIDDSQLVNLEEKWHHKYFLEGYEAHHDEKWHEVIKSMELALTEYWKADTQCRALCEGKYDNREFMDLYEAIAYHYASTLYCKSQCESWLSRINSKLVDDYLSSHFHFLQFAYYNVDDVQNAVKNALSFLILLPEDEVMLQNIAFYKGMKDPTLEFIPRTDVEKYHQLVEMENKMLQFAKRNFWEEDAEEFLNPDKDIEVEDESGPDYLGAEPIDPNEVNLKEGEEALLKKAEEAIGHETEKSSAKYSRDLNHNGEASSGQPRHQGNGDAEFAQSEGGGAGEMRSKILNGMKKVMKSLMGSSEEESEKLLLQLAKDPKSSEAKEKIKVAIERMMSSSDADKALPREQLKKMMQGLTQGTLMDDPQGKDGANGKKENFDPEAVGEGGKEMVFPSNMEGRMLDDKDYDPMKGLDRKEYFDWVNPPGFETGAPGSPETDDQDDNEDDDDDDDDADQPDYHGNEDEDNEIIGDREYYPSDEDADEEELSENVNREIDEAEDEANPDDSNHDDETKDEFCLPGEGCGDTSSNPRKYSEKQQTDPDLSQTEQAQEEQKMKDESNQDDDGKNSEDEDGDDGKVIEEDEEENEENKIEEEDKNEDEKERQEHNRKEDKVMERKLDEAKDLGYLEGKEHDRERDGQHDHEEEEESDWSCEEEDDGECIEEEEEAWVYEPRELTPAEEKIQEALDREVTDETKTWMEEMMKIDDNAYFLLNDLPDLEVVMTDDQLNGSNRVLADGLAADQECGTLLQLLDGEARQGNGYKGKTSPHTKFENFEGLTVKDAVDAASAGRIPLLYPTVYMHLAERSRQFLQRHFKLKSHLFFSYTHLVCRSAGPGIFKAYSSLKRRDLSHPVHADNCQLDHKGVCHKRLPAFVWRDWSAILYLNQDFEGGEFIFAHYNNTAQAQVNPKCGRLVGFSAGEENLHGVKGVIHGRRCALAMWYTLDPRFREIEFFGAADHLNLLYDKEYKQQHK